MAKAIACFFSKVGNAVLAPFKILWLLFCIIVMMKLFDYKLTWGGYRRQR